MSLKLSGDKDNSKHQLSTQLTTEIVTEKQKQKENSQVQKKNETFIWRNGVDVTG